MSKSLIQTEDSRMKKMEILDSMKFSIYSVGVESNEDAIYFNINIYDITIYNIHVTYVRGHYIIELPHGIHSPWSTPIPVISFWSNEKWTAIRWGIIDEIEKTDWMRICLKIG